MGKNSEISSGGRSKQEPMHEPSRQAREKFRVDVRQQMGQMGALIPGRCMWRQGEQNAQEITWAGLDDGQEERRGKLF